MELSKETIGKIEELVRSAVDLNIIEIDGKRWTKAKLERVLYEPKPATLSVASLSGLVDFINVNIDELDLADTVILVDSFKKVSLISATQGEALERARHIEAVVDPDLKVYPFEKYLEVEPFIIALRSMFEPSDDRERVIAYVSKVSGGTSFGLDDDGVTQIANVKKGVAGALTAKETAPAIIKMRPFRTFRDVPQVESEFLFRMKLIDTESQIVGAALFEADGGRWRNQAVQAIREYLTANLPDGPAVIA